MTTLVWLEESPLVREAVVNKFNQILNKKGANNVTFDEGDPCTIGGCPFFYADTSEFNEGIEYVTRTYFLKWSDEMIAIR